MSEDTGDPQDEGRDDLVRRRAYAIWEREGRPEGRDREHWEQARRDLETTQGSNAAGDRGTVAGIPVIPAPKS